MAPQLQVLLKVGRAAKSHCCPAETPRCLEPIILQAQELAHYKIELTSRTRKGIRFCSNCHLLPLILPWARGGAAAGQQRGHGGRSPHSHPAAPGRGYREVLVLAPHVRGIFLLPIEALQSSARAEQRPRWAQAQPPKPPTCHHHQGGNVSSFCATHLHLHHFGVMNWGCPSPGHSSCLQLHKHTSPIPTTQTGGARRARCSPHALLPHGGGELQGLQCLYAPSIRGAAPSSI